MQKVLQTLKNNYKYLIAICGFVYMIFMSVNYSNAGVNYDQQAGIRPFCIAFGIVLLGFMPLKTWLNIWTLIYLPICYFVTHYLYENHLIYDACKYEHIDIIRMGKMVAIIYGVLIIAVLVDLIKNKTYKEFKDINPILGGLWLVFSIVLALVLNPYYYSWFIIVAFGLTLYILRKEENRKFFILALRLAIIVAFVALTVKAMLHRPYYTGRYNSVFINSNLCGMFYACVNVALYVGFYEWWTKKVTGDKEKKCKIAIVTLYIILLGISLSLTIYNFTRTTIMGQALAFVITVVARIIRKESIKSMATRCLIVFVTMIIVFYPVYLGIRYIPAIVDDPISLAWEDTQGRHVVKGDPINSWKYTTFNECFTDIFAKLGIKVDFHTSHQWEEVVEEHEEVVEETGEVVTVVEVTEVASTVVDTSQNVTISLDDEVDMSNGRTEIWKAYIKLLNLWGHDDPEITMDNGEYIYHAHNTYLHVAYMHGIVLGALYVLVIVASLITSFVNYIKGNSFESGSLFVMLLLGTALLAQMTESIVHPCNILCYLIYISIVYVASIGNGDKLKK